MRPAPRVVRIDPRQSWAPDDDPADPLAWSHRVHVELPGADPVCYAVDQWPAASLLARQLAREHVWDAHHRPRPPRQWYGCGGFTLRAHKGGPTVRVEHATGLAHWTTRPYLAAKRLAPAS